MLSGVSRRFIAIMAGVCAVAVPLASIAPAEAQTNAMTVAILDPQPGTRFEADLDVTVAVDLGASDSGTLLVELGPVASTIDLPAGSCAGGCTRTTHLSVPNGDWAEPVESGPIYLRATVSAPDVDPTTQVYALTLDGPSRITGFAVVRNGVEHHVSPVLEGAATVRLEADDRQHDGDVAEMRIRGGSLFETIAAGDAPWIADGAIYKAEIPFDVSSVPDGDYLLGVRSRTATGRWGHGYEMWIRVSHVKVVSMTALSSQFLVVGDASVAVNVMVRGAIPGNLAPGALRVTLDGVEHTLTSPTWARYDWSRPGTQQTLQFYVPGGELSVGTHTVVFQLLSSSGQKLGAPLSRTYTVSDFSGTLSVPKVQVVGQRLTGTATGVAPTGYKLSFCSAGQSVAVGQGQELGYWCSSPLTQLSAAFTFTPQAAGTGSAVLTLQAAGHTRQHKQAVTVYAARRVAVTAPAVSYGSRGTARITVQDAKVLNQWQAAPSGVRVTLQRLTAGTSTWLTVGSAYTGSGGIASVPFTSVANGRFRVVATSSVPGQTITSPTIAAVSLAIVTWRRAPATALRGSTYVYEAATRPYENGVKAYLQVRPPGVMSWAGARTIAVPSTGIARFTYAFSRVGYWRVRVIRGSTALRTGAPSSTVGVSVR